MACRLDLYAGLLGSGKTTLIRRLLETEYAGKKVAVIENEIGRINLDAAQFAESQVSIRELTGGCVCCTIVGDFADAIDQIVAEVDPDVIIIEPTGAADLDTLLKACRGLTSAVFHRCVLVANAKRLARLLRVIGGFYHDQIKASNCIYLNFTETLTAEQIQEAKDAVRAIRKDVQIVDTPIAEITGESFRECGVVETGDPVEDRTLGAADDSEFIPVVSVRKRSSLQIRELGDREQTCRMMRMTRGKSKDVILYTTMVVYDSPLEEEQFGRIKELLAAPVCDGVWRAKGILPLVSGEFRRIDQTFGDVFEADADEPREDLVGRLVLIGPELSRAVAELEKI